MGSVVDDDSKPVGSYPPTGIDVLIIGTGLAGLTASIECIRKGHNVRVLERDNDINTAGTLERGLMDQSGRNGVLIVIAR